MQKNEIFAAIDVGSYELAMKIIELSQKRGVRELDHVTHRIDLGSETYATGRISQRHVRELAQILKEYREIMDGYGVMNYLAYGTSALRETKDIDVVLNLLRTETGVDIQILSNSEQRFLDYKSVALRGEEFDRIIDKPTAILDIGGGSLQVSLFDNDKLYATQNMPLGILRLHQTLQKLDASSAQTRPFIRELASSHIANFKKMYLRDRVASNLIVIDDYLSPFLHYNRIGALEDGYTTSEDFAAFLEKAQRAPRLETAKTLNIPVERMPLVKISALLIEDFAEQLGADTLWAPGVTLCDGVTYDYAERKKYLKASHDFERDIIACAQNMSKRYMGSKKRTEAVSKLSLAIFDAIKKLHGLGKRERLLLQIAALLNDCGKYISMLNVAESSYHIIMSTEMIGLSHREREIVANVVRLAHKSLDEISDFRFSGLDRQDNLIIAKLTAILRVAGGLDRTAQAKFKNVQVRLKDRELVLSVDPKADVAVERGLLDNHATLFTEVYGATVVIRQKADKKTDG